MKKIALFILTSLSVLSCKKENEGFAISGTVKNLKDSTQIYLSVDNKDIDSTYVIGEKFTFSGKVQEPTSAYIVVKKTRDYTSVWLENLPITFDAEQGNFKDAKITGSSIQKEVDNLRVNLKEIRTNQEKLNQSFRPDMSAKQQDSLYVEMEKWYKKEEEVYQNFIKENPNSRLSANILNGYASTWGKEKTEELFKNFSEDNKNSQYGKKISEFITLNNPPKIGEAFVDFEMKDPQGNSHKLSEVKGDIILLDFWASWCGPCRQENPNVVKAFQKYKDRGFNIFSVSLDKDKKAWEKAIEKDGLTWQHVSDLDGSENDSKITIIYGIIGIPDNFLIDMKTKKVIARGLRGEELEKKLEEVLK